MGVVSGSVWTLRTVPSVSFGCFPPWPEMVPHLRRSVLTDRSEGDPGVLCQSSSVLAHSLPSNWDPVPGLLAPRPRLSARSAPPAASPGDCARGVWAMVQPPPHLLGPPPHPQPHVLTGGCGLQVGELSTRALWGFPVFHSFQAGGSVPCVFLLLVCKQK